VVGPTQVNGEPNGTCAVRLFDIAAGSVAGLLFGITSDAAIDKQHCMDSHGLLFASDIKGQAFAWDVRTGRPVRGPEPRPRSGCPWRRQRLRCVYLRDRAGINRVLGPSAACIACIQNGDWECSCQGTALAPWHGKSAGQHIQHSRPHLWARPCIQIRRCCGSLRGGSRRKYWIGGLPKPCTTALT